MTDVYNSPSYKYYILNKQMSRFIKNNITVYILSIIRCYTKLFHIFLDILIQ